MTFDECDRALLPIRSKQGTPRPIIRVDYGGSVFQGRVARTDSDPGHRPESPYGMIVLEAPGLVHGPQTLLQIASIAPGSIRDVSEN